MASSPFMRQMLVAISTYLASFTIGGAITFPTLLMKNFHYNDTSIQLDIDTKSWIGSIYGLAGIPAILMPIITQVIGRKFEFIITCSFQILGWILAYLATTVTGILISECFHGLSTNSLMPICFHGLTEMLAPRYRMVSMQMYGIVQYIGIGACGIMGQFLDFRTVSLIMLVPVTLATVTACMWPESPSWLAYKGQFIKCEKSFIKLRGEDDVSKKELLELITAQRENLNCRSDTETISMSGLWRKISRKDFYLPTFHIFVLLTMMYWSGYDAILVNFIEIVEKSTRDEKSVLYASTAMYLISIVMISISNYLIVKFKNKTILLLSACSVITFLTCGFIISILQNFEVLASDSNLMIFCLLAIMACNSLGLAGIVFMISSEIIPVKHRSIVGSLFIIFNCALYASSLKLSPYLFLSIGIHGTFLVYISSTASCVLYVWKYVPETKNKTLQEIEDFYTHGKFIERTLEDTVTPIYSKK